MDLQDSGLCAALRFCNLLLSDTLRRAGFVLGSVLVGLQKLADGAPNRGVCPIAVGEAWYRFAMLCSLIDVGPALEAHLALLRVRLSTRGGVSTVAHVLAAALELGLLTLAAVLDCENVFNAVSVDAAFTAVRERLPRVLPVVQWMHPARTPLMSRYRVHQRDALQPLLLALTLQGPLKFFNGPCR
jgi:hypothetical protein